MSTVVPWVWHGMLTAGFLVSVINVDASTLADEATKSETRTGDLRTLLTRDGIQVAEQHVVLPEPALANRSQDVSQESNLKELAGNIGWERFSRQNLNSPVIIRVDPLQNSDSQPVGLLVRQAYIAYARLDDLRKRDFMDSIFSSGANDSEGEIRELTLPERNKLGIVETETDEEMYFYVRLPLLRKVMVRGVLRVQRRDQDNGIEVYWQLDPRFTETVASETPDDQDAASGELKAETQMKNTWSPLSTNELGMLVEGSPVAYRGMAGYMSVWPTGLEENQLLVESRMALHEPVEWFGGTKYLRSKLLISLQEGAKQFRRSLR